MIRAEEIGISLGTGLTRVRHRLDNDIDTKSKPGEEMPGWWISSTWEPPPESDDDDDDDDGANFSGDGLPGNNPGRDDDNNNNNGDNGDDNEDNRDNGNDGDNGDNNDEVVTVE